MGVRIETWKTNGKSNFRLVSSNGNVIVSTNQGYENTRSMKRAIQLVLETTKKTKVVEIDAPIIAPVADIPAVAKQAPATELKAEYDALVTRLGQGAPVPQDQLDALIARIAANSPMGEAEVAALIKK